MRRAGENFEFAAAGRLWTVPKALQPALAKLQNNREFAVRELAAALADAGARADLLKSLSVLAQAGVVLARKVSAHKKTPGPQTVRARLSGKSISR